MHHSFGSKARKQKLWKVKLALLYVLYSHNWESEFQDGWLIKSSFITTHNENESLSADQDQIPKKNLKNRIGNYPEVVESRVGESLSGDIF